MTIALSPLPYERTALEPHISAETLDYHYDKHHRGYVDKLNDMIVDTPFENLPLEEIVIRARESASFGILNNALQVWNHTFLWESMAPNGGSMPDGRVRELIESNFGDFGTFKQRFKEAALSQFGSGWAWLVLDGPDLRILTTSNADSALGTELTPLLTIDVWEHAYYIDYRNDRARYIDTFLDKLINWQFAASNLQKAEMTKAA